MLRFSQYTDNEISKFTRRLKFPRVEEKAFWEYHYEKTFRIVRYGMMALCLINSLNLFTDFSSFPSYTCYAVTARSVTTMMGFIIIILTYGRRLKWLIQPLLFITAIAAGLNIMSFTYIGDGIFSHLYHSGVMVVLIGMFVLQMRLLLSVSAGWILVLAYTIPHLAYGKYDTSIIMHNSGNMVAVVLIGMIIGYLNEYYMRKIFVQLNIIESEKKSVQLINLSIENELDLAKEILEQFIPANSQFSPIKSYYKPMKKIGGDFFTYITFQESQSIGLFISDVSGHGIPAAIITMMIKSIIDESGDKREDPSALMALLNDRLINHTAGNFVTALYCIYHPLDQTLVYTNAGHCPMLIISEDSINEAATQKLAPLGIWSNSVLEARGKSYSNAILPVTGNCRLMLYTDGLIEARMENEPELFFEYNGFMNSIKENISRSCGDFVETIVQRLMDFHGQDRFDDDVCLVCMDIQAS